MTTQTTNTEFTVDALSTESVVPVIRANVEQLICAMKTFVAASQIIDQFKRNFYYGEKGAFDTVKLQHYINEIREGAFELDYRHIIYKESYKDIPVDTRVAHGILGMSTEVGELMEVMISKVESGSQDDVNLAEEIGDVNFYEAILTDALGTTIDKCNEAVINKLKKRYPNGFSAQRAAQRDLDVERAELEAVIQQSTSN